MDGVWRVARKDHVCTLCEYTIPAGSRYHYERVTPWDHPDNERYFSFKTHRVCERAWLRIGPEWDWYSPDAGEWRQFLEGYYGLSGDQLKEFISGSQSKALEMQP